MKKVLLLLTAALVLGACNNDDASRTEIWTVAPEKGVAGINMGFGYVPAYIVRKGASASWETVAGPIEGFSFKTGSQTTLRVRIDRIANPPADGRSERYTMEEQLAQTESAQEIDPLIFSPVCEVMVASRGPMRRWPPTGSGICGTGKMLSGRLSRGRSRASTSRPDTNTGCGSSPSPCTTKRRTA